MRTALNSNLILLIRKEGSSMTWKKINFKFQSDSINTCFNVVSFPVITNTFKFQSDSINTNNFRNILEQSRNFKFQSDSINTMGFRARNPVVLSLNSNLILLIRILDILNICTHLVFKFQSDSINTEEGCHLLAGVGGFKFQSDSINTFIIPPWNLIGDDFKFQSDSINTISSMEEERRSKKTLNSNLILLILRHVWKRVRLLHALNSNLILLIRHLASFNWLDHKL